MHCFSLRFSAPNTCCKFHRRCSMMTAFMKLCLDVRLATEMRWGILPSKKVGCFDHASHLGGHTFQTTFPSDLIFRPRQLRDANRSHLQTPKGSAHAERNTKRQHRPNTSTTLYNGSQKGSGIRVPFPRGELGSLRAVRSRGYGENGSCRAGLP